MKLIKPGTKWWIGKKIKCPNCGALLEIEPNDLIGFVPKKGIQLLCIYCSGWSNHYEPKSET